MCPYCGTKNFKEDNEKIAALVVRMQDGDASAFDELYFYMQKYVRYIAGGIVKNAELTEDVVQEVFISIYKNINSVKEPEKAKGWIKTITYNQALQTVKKEAKYVLLSEEEETDKFDNLVETDTFVMPGHALEQEDTQKLFMSFLDELPVKQKIALESFYFDGKQIKQIAEETGISENTIKTSLRRGKMALAEKIEAWSKKTGEKLYTIPMAPVLYMLFRKGIDGAAVTSTLPAALASVIAEITGKSAASGTAGVSAAKKAAGTVVKKAGTKAVAAKVIAGVAAVAVIGTGSYMYATKDERAIREVVTDFTEACQNLDEEALRECMSEDALVVLDDSNLSLVDQYLYSEYTGKDIEEYTDFDLNIKEISIEENNAEVLCEYRYKNDNNDINIRLKNEGGDWKLELSGFQKSNIENEYYTSMGECIVDYFTNNLESGHTTKGSSYPFYISLNQDANICRAAYMGVFTVNEEMTEFSYTVTLVYNDVGITMDQIREMEVNTRTKFYKDHFEKGGDGTVITEQTRTVHLTKESGEWTIIDPEQLDDIDIREYRFPEFIMDAAVKAQ